MLGSYEDCETILDCLDKEENAVNTMYESFAKAAPLVEALPENNKMKESLSNTISEYEPYMGSFYWMNSKNMKFDSDFKLDKSDYGVVRWTNAQITVKLDGKNVPYPLVVLDGKNYGLLEDLAFNDLKAKGNIQEGWEPGGHRGLPRGQEGASAHDGGMSTRKEHSSGIRKGTALCTAHKGHNIGGPSMCVEKT